MTNTNIQDRTMMPEFTIDTIVTDSGKEIPGIKRMYDIALAINDSIMQWGAPGIGKSQAVYQWNAEKVEEYNKRTFLASTFFLMSVNLFMAFALLVVIALIWLSRMAISF